MSQLYADEPFEQDLCGPSAISRSSGRPILATIGIVAVAALALGGLYQGYRFTFQQYGPAPHYAWPTATPTPPVATPEVQVASADTKPAPARRKLEVADNDADAPDVTAPPTDATQFTPVGNAAVAPVGAAPLIQPPATPPAPPEGAEPAQTADQPPL